MVLTFAYQKGQNNNMNLQIIKINWDFILYFYKEFVIIDKSL